MRARAALQLFLSVKARGCVRARVFRLLAPLQSLGVLPYKDDYNDDAESTRRMLVARPTLGAVLTDDVGGFEKDVRQGVDRLIAKTIGLIAVFIQIFFMGEMLRSRSSSWTGMLIDGCTSLWRKLTGAPSPAAALPVPSVLPAPAASGPAAAGYEKLDA